MSDSGGVSAATILPMLLLVRIVGVGSLSRLAVRSNCDAADVLALADCFFSLLKRFDDELVLTRVVSRLLPESATLVLDLVLPRSNAAADL